MKIQEAAYYLPRASHKKFTNATLH